MLFYSYISSATLNALSLSPVIFDTLYISVSIVGPWCKWLIFAWPVQVRPDAMVCSRAMFTGHIFLLLHILLVRAN